jgi:hypothetical protein
MDDTNLLRNLGAVGAPADFEGRVMTALARRKAAAAADRRTRTLRYSLAGAAAALFAGFLTFNVVLPGREDSSSSGASALAELRDSLPITETMSYRNEVRNSSLEPRTVYILEQVSDASYKHIKY